jgi:hypothetical protein
MLRDNLAELNERMRNRAGADPLAPSIEKQASNDRLPRLKNSRPCAAKSALIESVTRLFTSWPIFHCVQHVRGSREAAAEAVAERVL